MSTALKLPKKKVRGTNKCVFFFSSLTSVFFFPPLTSVFFSSSNQQVCVDLPCSFWCFLSSCWFQRTKVLTSKCVCFFFFSFQGVAAGAERRACARPLWAMFAAASARGTPYVFYFLFLFSFLLFVLGHYGQCLLQLDP